MGGSALPIRPGICFTRTAGFFDASLHTGRYFGCLACLRCAGLRSSSLGLRFGLYPSVHAFSRRRASPRRFEDQ